MSDEQNETGTYAVTGAGGFIGGRLVSHLLEAGNRVIAIVRDSSQGVELRAAGAEVREADVTDLDSLIKAFDGADGVFHLAGLFNHPDRTWDEYRAVNVDGTINVLTAAGETAVKRVVHCSTVGVATEAEAPPYSEGTPYSPQPNDKYEVTKAEAEQAALEFARRSGGSLSVIRLAQAYGPGDLSKIKFYKLVRKGIIVHPGNTLKHLVFIDDLCRAFDLAMHKPEADGEVFLIAGNEPTPLDELVSIAAEELAVAYPKVRLPAAPVTFACATVEWTCNLVGVKPPLFKRSMDFFTRSVECDMTKARDVLGFYPETSVRDGVRRTIHWYRSKGLI